MTLIRKPKPGALHINEWLSGAEVADAESGAGSIDLSTKIALAFVQAAGKEIVFSAGRYACNINAGAVEVNLRGAGRPAVLADKTGLVGGTIITGALSFTGDRIGLQAMGIDRGSARFGIGGDCLKISHPTKAGQRVSLKDVSAIGRSLADANHAILVEGYRDGLIDGVHAGKNQFGMAVKLLSSNIGSVRTFEAGTGMIVKSDAGFGTSSVCTIGEHINEGLYGSSAVGLRILAADASIYTISVGQVVDIDSDSSLTIEAAAGVAISGVSVGSLLSRNSRLRALTTGGAGGIYAVSVGSLNAIECNAQAFDLMAGNTIKLGTVYASAKVASPNITNFANVSGAVAYFDADSLALIENYSPGTRRGITYGAGNVNRVGMCNATQHGSMTERALGTFDSVGVTANLTPVPYAEQGQSALVKVTAAAATTITAIDTLMNTGKSLPMGYTLSIMNISGFAVTLKNNAVIRNVKTNADRVMTVNQVAQYIWGGTSWHEVA